MVIAADRRQARVVLRYVRGAPRVSAQILPGPQSDRAGLRQVQDFAAKGRSPTYDAVADASAAILAQYPPEECAAYVKNAGYA